MTSPASSTSPGNGAAPQPAPGPRPQFTPAPPAPARISFGPRDDDSMPASWASRGLTWLKENRPSVFADMMLAIVGVERSRGRS